MEKIEWLGFRENAELLDNQRQIVGASFPRPNSDRILDHADPTVERGFQLDFGC